jgi:DNA-binding MarR family transcriptional regulator
MTADHDAEMDAIVAELEAAGYIEVYTDDQGREAYRLTTKDAALGRQLAMLEGDEQRDELMEHLLGEQES